MLNKLTAGIFAGILTIVTVNAADAAIASKAYVDEQRDATRELVTTNTESITALTQTVADNKKDAEDSIAGLKETVDALTEGGSGSVADQIANALGDIPENSTVSAELGRKQDKSTADYMMGTATGGWKALEAAQISALNSGVTTATVGQVATNTSDIATNKDAIEANATAIEALGDAYKAADTAINTKIGNLPEGTTSVVQMITKVQSDAANSVDEKLEQYSTTEQMETALDGKVDVNTAVASQMITTDANGQITTLPVTEGANGTYVLTATVDNGKATYYWENIQRGTATATTTE